MTTCLPASGDATPAPQAPRPNDAYDVVTVLTLLLGGFLVPVVGWLAGVILLWASPRFGTGQKWLGTLVWPGVVIVALVPVAVGAAVAGAQAGPWFVAGLALGVIGVFVALPWVFVRLLQTRRTA